MSEIKIDENYEFFLKKFGKPHKCQIVEKELIADYQNKLPSQLFTYWQLLGCCGYANGLIWMTNPSEYQDILDGWLKGTSFAKRKDLSVIARNAFGELYVWCKEKGDIMTIVPTLGVIYFYPEKYERSLSQDDENKYMRYFWGTKKTKFVVKSI